VPKRYWLMKSEPEVYSIEDLARDKRTLWEGVRNYQARNFMTNDMSIGDEVIFYHSNAEPPGAAGVAHVSGKAVPDPTQFQKKNEYYEPRATLEKPVWFCVELEYAQTFKKLVTLAEIKAEKTLSGLALLQKGQRLSVQPVEPKHFAKLVSMGGGK
jgi:predicted RNA-binding protein with PUA-like domain